MSKTKIECIGLEVHKKGYVFLTFKVDGAITQVEVNGLMPNMVTVLPEGVAPEEIATEAIRLVTGIFDFVQRTNEGDVIAYRELKRIGFTTGKSVSVNLKGVAATGYVGTLTANGTTDVTIAGE